MKIIKFTVEEAEICFCGLSYMFSNYESRKDYQSLLIDHKIKFSHDDLNFMSDLIASYSKDDDMLLNIEIMKNLKKINQYEDIFLYSSSKQGEICFKTLIDKINENIDHAADIPLWQFDDNKQAFLSYTNGNLRALINNDNKLIKYAWWNGSAWELISEENAFVIYGDFYKQCCIELEATIKNSDSKAIQDNNKKIAKWNSSKNSKEAMESLKRDRRYIIDMSKYNRPNHIICSNNGKIINLITGEIKNATRNDMVLFTSKNNLLDKETAIKFIDEKFKLYTYVLGIDRLNFLLDLIAYKLSGKSLQKAIFLIGTGGTGKSLFKSIIKDLFSDRVVNIPYEYFTTNHKGNDDKSRDDVMTSLDNKLIGISSESEESNQLVSQARFKTILSGSIESARATRGTMVDIDLKQLDLIIDTNNLPSFSNVDYAISRRLLFVNFINKIPKEKINPNYYSEEIKPYSDYIFSYFVYRAIDLTNKEFIVPSIINNDTFSNLNNIDPIAKFASMKISPLPGHRIKFYELEKIFSNFCRDESMPNILDNYEMEGKKCSTFIKVLKEKDGYSNIFGKRDLRSTDQGRFSVHGIAFIDESEDNPFINIKDQQEKLSSEKEIIENKPIIETPKTWQQMYMKG